MGRISLLIVKNVDFSTNFASSGDRNYPILSSQLDRWHGIWKGVEQWSDADDLSSRVRVKIRKRMLACQSEPSLCHGFADKFNHTELNSHNRWKARLCTIAILCTIEKLVCVDFFLWRWAISCMIAILCTIEKLVWLRLFFLRLFRLRQITCIDYMWNGYYFCIFEVLDRRFYHSPISLFLVTSESWSRLPRMTNGEFHGINLFEIIILALIEILCREFFTDWTPFQLVTFSS
jgi:hypothetical protein